MSSNRLKVIFNPSSGRAKTKNNEETLKQALNNAGLEFDLTVTETASAGTAEALAAIKNGYQTVVAAGGDNTINSVVNGLVQAAGEDLTASLGIIPLGIANDLANTLYIPKDIDRACQKLATGKTRIIDVGQVNNHFFINNSGVGLEPLVNLHVEKKPNIKSLGHYLFAFKLAMWKRPRWYAEIKWDTGSFTGPIILLSIGNSARFDGFFRMTPDAQLDDGKFDIVYITATSRLWLPSLFISIFKNTHLKTKQVVYLKSKTLSIEMDTTALHADGNVIEQETKLIKYSILPQKLRVIV